MHPRNPYAPSAHCNLRYFETQSPDGTAAAWWFGGGADLTPYYPVLDDVRDFIARSSMRATATTRDFYPAFKTWCDRYFYLTHRNETRGVGGIFYDYLDAERVHARRSCSHSSQAQPAKRSSRRTFRSSNAARRQPFGERERSFQLLRRGRYVEFNLLYDRGTLFGLQSGGRVESILMSLPPLVRWAYDERPQPGSPEAALQRLSAAARLVRARIRSHEICGSARQSRFSGIDERTGRASAISISSSWIRTSSTYRGPLRALIVKGLILPTRPPKSAARVSADLDRRRFAADRHLRAHAAPRSKRDAASRSGLAMRYGEPSIAQRGSTRLRRARR